MQLPISPCHSSDSQGVMHGWGGQFEIPHQTVSLENQNSESGSVFGIPWVASGCSDPRVSPLEVFGRGLPSKHWHRSPNLKFYWGDTVYTSKGLETSGPNLSFYPWQNSVHFHPTHQKGHKKTGKKSCLRAWGTRVPHCRHFSFLATTPWSTHRCGNNGSR